MIRDDLKHELLALDAQYEQITGHCAFLYVDNRAGGPGEFHFTEDRVMYGVRSALAHMKALLHQAAEDMEESA